MCKRLKKEEEETKHYTRCLDDLMRQHLSGGDKELGSPSGDQESIISDHSEEGAQDSPATKMCRVLSKHISASWRSQRHLTKVVTKVLSMDAGLSNRSCPCCTGACSAAPVASLPCSLGEEAPQASLAALTAPSQPLPVEPSDSAPEALPIPQLLPPLPLGDTDAAVEFKVSEAEGKLGPDVSLQESLPATPQPEEEADGPLPRKSGPEDSALPQPLKSKLLAAEEALSERATVEGSRNSTISDAEPAREPQPLGQSPRDPIEELSSSTDTPMLESPGGATSSSFARPSASGPEHEEGLVTEADSSMNSSGSGEVSANIEEDLVDYSAIKPGEDGMERMCTMLHAIEQGELKRELYIMVPDGIGADRKVRFSFENKNHEIAVPEGYEVGQQVLITITNRPFLERTAGQALRRGHPQPDFPDRWSIIDNLRHSLRTDVNQSTLTADEFRNRYNLYMLLRGRCGAPLLPFTEEEMPEGMVTVG